MGDYLRLQDENEYERSTALQCVQQKPIETFDISSLIDSSRFSSFTTLIRVTARVLRIIRATQLRQDKSLFITVNS